VGRGRWEFARRDAAADGSVGAKQLRKNAVTGAKVKNRSITAADIKVGSPAGVASAVSAASAAHANAAARLDKLS
jgi:hypothetical protein